MVARLWLQADEVSGASGDDALADAELGGLDAEGRATIASWLAHSEKRDVAGAGEGIWPRHIMAARAFLAAATQWRTGLFTTAEGLVSRFIGLDYAAAAVAWQAMDIVLSAEDFGHFTAIEGAATSLLNGGDPA